MHVIIFEDANWINFAPISLTRPVFSSRAGMYSLLERQVRALNPSKLTLWVRPQLVDICKKYLPEVADRPVQINTPLDNEPALLVNARCLDPERIDTDSFSGIHCNQAGEFVAAMLAEPGLSANDALTSSERWNRLSRGTKANPTLQTATYLWDLLSWNQAALQKDIVDRLANSQPITKPAGPFHLMNEAQIFIGRNVKLAAGCVLDATTGPIYLAEDVVIGPNAVLQGPCYIGNKSQISPLASIRPGANIASQCKIGGEVSNSIFMSCSNKAHDGFVGDSYIGEWVNFGAGATTSNLKNTYGPISIRIGSRTLPTGKQFLGSLVGDHTKFAIQTRLMTGSYIGFNCMVASSTLTPTYVPSLTFLTDKGSAKYETDKAKEVMAAVMKRRNRDWAQTDDALLEYAKGAAEIAEK